MSDTETLKSRLKEIIVESLYLDVEPSSIGDRQPLFGEGLGLDSVDALELVVAMEQEYGIKIRSHEIDPSAFADVESLSRYVGRCRESAAAGAG